ncbi:MAG: prolyl oligopeptidase family serine peptidase [Saprospiraceae bacterium]|nr:prolyl oligopeptidase family serine peptidase [Saprospiraceae bacterium]
MMLYQLKRSLFKCIFFIGLCYVRLLGGKVDTISIPSAAMNKSFNALVFLPSNYEQSNKSYPVLYLLHGHSSDPSSWYFVIPKIREWADRYQMILVCPDGDYDSWYLDGPNKTDRKFETYIALEVPKFIDQCYRSLKGRESRGISGISMGGHGAVYLAHKHPDQFSCIGSSSGGLDLIPFYREWNLYKLLGDPIKNRTRWEQSSCLYLLNQHAFKNQKLYIDCGTEDFFLEVNRTFHKKLEELRILHRYVESKGDHSIPYWRSAYEKQILFFDKNLAKGN